MTHAEKSEATYSTSDFPDADLSDEDLSNLLNQPMTISAHRTLLKEQLAIYSVALQVHPSTTEVYFSILSLEERRRADKFRFERDRTCFVVTRGSLRMMIASFTGQAGDQIEFRYSRYGKPELKGESSLQFNVSHSGNYALIAFSQDLPVGIDIEQNASDQDLQLVANHVFL